MAALVITMSVPWSAATAGTWTQLANVPPEGVSTMLLLSDGTVMAAGAGSENMWYRLKPDSQGNYANGKWSTLATMNFTREFYSSDVLTNGRVLVAGGEYGTGTETAEVYDPIANTWTVTPSSDASFSDSISEMLPNGNVLVGPAISGGFAIYATSSNDWTRGAGNDQDEASWVKLPDDSILTVDPFGTHSERYIPSLGQWIPDAIVPVQLWSSSGEIGPALLLPDGRAFYLGGSGNTAFYTPSGGTNEGSWQAGPVIPNSGAASDAPAAMMVNGNVLCVFDLGGANQASFYEYDPVANAFTQVNTPSGGTIWGSTTTGLRMLDLPDGSVLFSSSAYILYEYRPSGGPLAAGKPAISNLVQNADGSFHLTGTGFNGISAGAAYGDDAQMDSNYPLVRMTNMNNGNVYYARTYNWNSTSVMTGNRIIATDFVLPTNLPSADYMLVAVANGISSDPIAFSTSLQPVIVQPVLSSNEFLFSFATVTGQNYVVEYKNQLTNGNWIPLQTNAGNGGIETVTNALTASRQRFFRLQLL